jgi:hypothetical protein
VSRNNAATRERRALLEADFRTRLDAELPGPSSAVRDALVASAASAFVEITETTARYLRCRAGAEQMERLSTVRSELNRTLRLLGVTPKPQSDTTDQPPGGALQRYLVSKAAQEAAVTTPSGDDGDGTN